MLFGSEMPLKPILTELRRVLKSLCKSGAQSRQTSRRAAKKEPLNPTSVLTLDSRLRINISYLTYNPSPLTFPWRSMNRSSLLTHPISGWLKLTAICLMASGSRIVATSENTRDRQTQRFWLFFPGRQPDCVR